MPSNSYRPFRLEIGGILHLGTYHVGTGQRLSLTTDAPVLVDEKNRPYLPGSSLRGVLRSHLEREVGHLGGSIETLFGETPTRRQDDGQSVLGRLIVQDAKPVEAAADREVRDHVRVNARTGAAVDGAKFDSEVALATQLELRLLYEGESSEDPELALVKEALRALQEEDLTCGAKSGWGYGRLRLSGVRTTWYDRKTPAGMARWLSARIGAEAANSGEFLWPQPQAGAGLAESISWIEFGWVLAFDGPALVRAPIPPLPGNAPRDARTPAMFGSIGRETADDVFLTTGPDAKPYLPGSSLRGVLRHHAERIARAMTGSATVVEELFGRIKSNNGDLGQKSRIEVGDGVLVDAPNYVFLDHVAIDRITGFAADKKKFSTCALASPRFRGTLRIRFGGHQMEMLALAAFVLRDLREGWLWAGGGVTRGYGHIKDARLISATADLAPELSPPDNVLPGVERKQRPGHIRLKTGETAFEDWGWLWQKAEASWCASLDAAGGMKS